MKVRERAYNIQELQRERVCVCVCVINEIECVRGRRWVQYREVEKTHVMYGLLYSSTQDLNLLNLKVFF